MLQATKPTTVFFDADALIAGSASREGASFILLQLSELGLLNGLTCQQAVDECRKSLSIKLPDALPVFEQILSRALTVLGNPTEEEVSVYQKMAHRKDVPILTVAVTTGTRFLVTFNTKDFYPDHKLGLEVLTPGDLLKRIRARLSGLTG